MVKVYSYENNDEIAQSLAKFIIAQQDAVLGTKEKFSIAISGGSLINILAKGLLKNDQIKWPQWVIYFSDERVVPFHHEDSNFGAFDEAVLEGYKRGFKKEVTDTERQEIIRRVTGLGDGYGVGISVGDNIKAKLGGMFDDVMSLKSKKSFTGGSGDNEGKGSKIDEIISNDWEIQELTTLDGINDYEYENDDDNDDENDVDIQLAVPLPSHDIYQSVNGVHDLNSVDYEEGSSH